MKWLQNQILCQRSLKKQFAGMVWTECFPWCYTSFDKLKM
jgi:hypothetical protein